MGRSHHIEFYGGRWDCSLRRHVLEITPWYITLIWTFSLPVLLCQCLSALLSWHCRMQVVPYRVLAGNVAPEGWTQSRVAAGRLQWEIISRVAWDSVVCSSCKKPSFRGIFLWLPSPLQKIKNIWHLKIGYILNHCKCHLFSKKQLVEKNNLGLKPCMKLPFKISGVGFVIFIFLEVWRKGCLMATERKQKCGTTVYVLQTCREVASWRPVK